MLHRNLPTLFANRDTGVESISDWMDRVFDEVANRSGGTFVPTLNVAETDQSFEVTVALPGMSKEDVEIHYENDILTISGERKWEHDENKNGRRFHRVEFGYGKFNRSLPLPNYIDSDNINAEFRNGELMITLPKTEEKAGKKIQVK